MLNDCNEDSLKSGGEKEEHGKTYEKLMMVIGPKISEISLIFSQVTSSSLCNLFELGAYGLFVFVCEYNIYTKATEIYFNMYKYKYTQAFRKYITHIIIRKIGIRNKISALQSIKLL